MCVHTTRQPTNNISSDIRDFEGGREKKTEQMLEGEAKAEEKNRQTKKHNNMLLLFIGIRVRQSLRTKSNCNSAPTNLA